MGSIAHEHTRLWIVSELEKYRWNVNIQETPWSDYTIYNISGCRGQGSPWILIGAHYDSRFHSDQDDNPANHLTPVIGANDGASGVAVLLELARSLPKDLDKHVCLVFFDAEDNGNIAGFDWILGSKAYVEALTEKPDVAVVIDMIGDKDLSIYYEKNSNPEISQSIWDTAFSLGYEQFIPQSRYRILDDHIPFKLAGIQAVDIIDFDYPYWHTTADTLDKISVDSLGAVGNTLLKWIIDYPAP